VKPQLRIVTGARKGLTAVFSRSPITIGRHPDTDFRLDPEGDLDASARHAELVFAGGKWHVHDAGSRNGTYVNGHRIQRDTPLADTDQIQLGQGGPRLEFRLVADSVPDGVVPGTAVPGAPPAAHREAVPVGPGRVRETSGGQRPRESGIENRESGTPRPTAGRRTPGGARAMSTTQRVRIEVGRATRRLRALTIVLLGVLVIVAGGFLYLNYRQGQEQEREMAAIQARTDSVLAEADAALRALRGQVEGLADALRTSQREVARLQQELTAAQRSGSATEVADVRRRLSSATQSLQYQQLAAQVDYRGIVSRNQRAVAMVWVRFSPDSIFTGTAFAVRDDGTLVTNRHVVAGPDGNHRPTDIAVRFADSDQTWRGRVLAVSREVDLALIKASGFTGRIPTVQGLNARADTLAQGDPVAIVGFPLGLDLPMTRGVARTTFTAGSVSKVLRDLVQIDGYGAEGASGSPVFDRNGDVISVLYGGQVGTGGRIVFSVPAAYVVRLLETIE
jgi:S1-C subfamily serine protease